MTDSIETVNLFPKLGFGIRQLSVPACIVHDPSELPFLDVKILPRRVDALGAKNNLLLKCRDGTHSGVIGEDALIENCAGLDDAV
jgi:hypothetical protein